VLQYIGFGGQGKQVRDMLHVDDLLRLIIHEIEHMDELNGRTFNVGGGLGVSASLLELTHLCQEITGNTIEIKSQIEGRPADIPIYITDNTRVTNETGWSPQKDVRAILTEICTWIQQNEEALRPILT